MKLTFVPETAPDIINQPRGSRRALWTMLRQVCSAAALVHVVFLLLFASLGLTMLVWANVASVALFICSGVLLSHRRNRLAMTLVVGEVTLHAVVVSLLLGWESGFHYYLLTIIGPLAVGMQGTTISKLARLLAFGAVYAALDSWTKQVPPVYRLEPILLDSIRYLNLAGMLAIMAFVSLAYSRLIASAENALQTLASTDSLTGLYNRRRLLEIAEAMRTGSHTPGLCVMLCDVDHFKHVNDRHGHEMGDLVLQQVAGVITATVRSTDSVARWGGEEFVVLLPGMNLVGATQTGERIRSAVAALSLHRPGPPSQVPPAAGSDLPIPVTITIGVALVDKADTIDAAIARADAALYRGKVEGRDRVVADGDATVRSFD